MSETTLATMLIVAILVLGVVMESISLPQLGVASRGCTPGSIADEASNGLCLRDTPTDFTVTGTGTGNSKSFKCNPPVPPDLTISMNFLLSINGGIANGTYFIFASDGNSVPGVLTDGSTNGNTFTLSGINTAACEDNQGNAPTDTITISGRCGDGVKISYRDPNTKATFTGNVECILT